MKHSTLPEITGRSVLAAMLAGLVFTGIASAAAEPAIPEKPATAAVKSLADTHWRLLEFQSMDDAIGTMRTDDPSKYTMWLRGDGTVVLRLNCNSATGSWSAEAGQDPSSGRFAVGPLAATMAVCPPPSMDEQVTAQAPYLRSYLLKDGRLYLSLMADGGIYVWESQADDHFQTKPDAEIEAAILQATPFYSRDIVSLPVGADKGRYVYGRVDLNDDSRDEVFVYLLGSIFCGTGGCNLQLFTSGPDGYTLIDEFPISRLPVIVSPEKTAGWNDIWRLESGGGAPASYVRHCFDGTHYVECGRVPADKVPQGNKCLSGELSFDKGIVLEPRD